MTPLLTADDVAALPRPVQRRLERAVRGVPPFFADFLERAWPAPAWRWDWPYMRYLTSHLQRVADAETTRLLISMPPRHGKTHTATLRFPIYMLAADPSLPVILAAYNHQLATKYSRLARRYARHVGIPISRERTAGDDWETEAGGGIRAAGVGTGVTGNPGGLIVIDDPIKSAKEAASLTYRDATWDWFRQDIWTRREPGAAVVVILTRWHEDDLAGRILASDDGPRWTVINLPALNDRQDDPLGRPVWTPPDPPPPGSALCPERYDETALLEARDLLEAHNFSAMFQGNPTPREGNMFPKGSIKIVQALPAGARMARFWDKAGTEGGGKYTAGVKMAEAGGLYYVVNVVRGRWAAGRRRAVQRETAELDGPEVTIQLEQEPGSSGKDSAADDVRALAGFVVSAIPATGEKAVRASPFAAQWQAGNVRLIRGDWNKAYLEELEHFPHGTYADQVDASSGVFRMLTVPQRPRVPWFPGQKAKPQDEEAT